MLSKRSKEETTNLPRTGGEPSQLRLLVISMIILVLQAITLAIVLIFRQFICLFLKLKYGKRFGGFMSPGDVIWMGDDDSEHITNTVVLMDSKMKSEQFNLSFKKDIIENPMVHNHPLTDLKLCSSCHSFMGYVFYLKDNNNKLDCITMLDCGDSNKDFMEKSDLTDVLSECATRPLPRNNSVLWEVVTIKQPLKVENAENGVHTNVVIFRFHHAMGDGMSIVNFLLRNLTDDQQKIHDHLDKLTKRAFNRNKAHQKSAISTSLKNNYLRLLQLVMMGPYILKRGMLRFKNNQNILHGTRLSRDKYVVYSTERDGERLLDAMKQMKNEVPGGMLSAVALTAISRALRRFYSMNSKEVPSSVPVSMPIPMTVPKIEEKIITKNSLSAALLSLPLLSSKTTVRNQLAAVVEEIRGAISQPDVVVRYIMANDFIGYLPKNLIQNFFTTGAVSTFTFSNLPGVPATTTFQHVLRDIIFITPNFGKCGLGFSMITYRDTLSFGLIVDKTLIPQKQAAQDLLDDVLEEIRMMYDQFKRNM